MSKNKYDDRSRQQIEELNKKIRPLVKRGILNRLCYVTFLGAKDEYMSESSVGVAKKLSKLRVVDILLPLRDYEGSAVVTPEIVLNQLSNKELRDVTNYYVDVPQPAAIPVERWRGCIEAKVELYGQKKTNKTSKSKTK